MALTIQQLFTASTSTQVRTSLVNNLIALGIPANNWPSGGVASTMLTVVSISIAVFSSIVVTLIQGFFLPTATGSGLALLAQYVYGVTPASATFASGNVTLTNSGGGVYTIGIGGLTVGNTQTGVNYTNTAGFTLNASSSLTINVQALTLGSAGNAVVGAITTMVTTLLGVSVNNSTALVGLDAPSDPTVRLLCTNKLGILGVRGVRTAYAYAVQTALNAVTLAPVNINRWSITESSHIGQVQVYLASPSGTPDPNDVLGVSTNVEAIARPAGVNAIVSGATGVTYAPTITVWCQSPQSVSASAIQTACANQLATYISQYQIGGITANDDANPTGATGLFADGVRSVLGAAVSSVGATLVSTQGATDLALTINQVATDGITVTVRVIPQTSGTLVQ